MKREIKFRGNRLDIGEFAYGSIVPMTLPNERVNTAIVRYGWIHSQAAEPSFGWDFVDPSTVGQYTGLKDKNGREIYEGDIFIELECLPGDNIPRKVTFENGAFRCEYIKKHWAKGYNNVPFHFLYDLKNGNIEVIGNIHDNPELLEDKK